MFDNSKIKRVAGDFTCETDLTKILEPIRYFKQRHAANAPYSTDNEALIDRIIAEQLQLAT